MSSATDLDLARGLLETAQAFPPERNPMLMHLSGGALDRRTLRPFGAMIVALAEQLPYSICALLSTCTVRAVRESMIANLLEEEGMALARDGKLRVDRTKSHGALARRFARATGLTDQELDAGPDSPNRWFREELRNGNWLGPFAFFSLGFEANVPSTYERFLSVLRTRWHFSDEELVFFHEHVAADERHGVEAAGLIASLATSAGARAQALEGARRGGIAFWHLHRLCAEEARRLSERGPGR